MLRRDPSFRWCVAPFRSDETETALCATAVAL